MLFSVEAVACLLLQFSEEIQALEVHCQAVLRSEAGHIGVLQIKLFCFYCAVSDFFSKILCCHTLHVDRKVDIGRKISKIKSNSQDKYEKYGKEGFFPEFCLPIGVF